MENMNFETFNTRSEAEDFVNRSLTYRDGSQKHHTLSYSDYWKCWIVYYRGRTIEIRPYEVTFVTKRNRQVYQWKIHVTAENKLNAKQLARQMWVDDERLSVDRKNRIIHMFHVESHRLLDTEEYLYHYFKRVKCC